MYLAAELPGKRYIPIAQGELASGACWSCTPPVSSTTCTKTPSILASLRVSSAAIIALRVLFTRALSLLGNRPSSSVLTLTVSR